VAPLRVAVSSTVLDLAAHRDRVLQACNQAGAIPRMMEILPAADATPIETSLALIDDADVYVGVFAGRYGYVPPGQSKSITEMEYDRAVERQMPRLIFVMDPAHPIVDSQPESVEAKERLADLVSRIRESRFFKTFRSPDELHLQVLHAIMSLCQAASSAPSTPAPRQARPQPFIAHPYPLLQTPGVVGRGRELSDMNLWFVPKDNQSSATAVFALVAVGGSGKSALAWDWFRSASATAGLDGSIWWSFYEPNASFDRFVRSALEYAADIAPADIGSLSESQAAETLFATLEQGRLLVVLDGVERLLLAYAGTDNGELLHQELDTEVLLAGPHQTEPSAGHLSADRYRRATNPDVGAFLRRLADLPASRVVLTSRLYPRDLETVGGVPVAGVTRYELSGLTPDDAVLLWTSLGAKPDDTGLPALLSMIGYHPLLIQVLAGTVAKYPPAPGNLDRWLADHPGFGPFDVELRARTSHVLAVSLRDLDGHVWQVAKLVAGFRRSVDYGRLAQILVGEGPYLTGFPREFRDASRLDDTLTELQERGLVGRDDGASASFAMHPIVRGVIWSAVSEHESFDISRAAACSHLLAWIGEPADSAALQAPDEAVEFTALLARLGLRRLAWTVYEATLHGELSAEGDLTSGYDLLAAIFPSGMVDVSFLAGPHERMRAARLLAMVLGGVGRTRQAEEVLEDVLASVGAQAGLTSVGRALIQLGAWKLALGDFEEAQQCFELAKALAWHLLDIDMTLTAESQLTLLCVVRGKMEDARRRAQALLETSGAVPGSPMMLHPMEPMIRWIAAGGVEDMDLATLASRFGERGLTGRSGIISSLAVIFGGAAALVAGNVEDAGAILTNGLASARAQGFALGQANAALWLAILQVARDEFDLARATVLDALDVVEDASLTFIAPALLLVLSIVEERAGHRESAADAARRSFTVARGRGGANEAVYFMDLARARLKSLRVPEPPALPTVRRLEARPLVVAGLPDSLATLQPAPRPRPS
jgi:Domain of unknown function (DUF4062)